MLYLCPRTKHSMFAMVMIVTHRRSCLPKLVRGLVAVLCWPILGSLPLRAADLYSAGDFDVRWDNTLRYSAGLRIDKRNPALLKYPNSDDGDRDFAPGLI